MNPIGVLRSKMQKLASCIQSQKGLVVNFPTILLVFLFGENRAVAQCSAAFSFVVSSSTSQVSFTNSSTGTFSKVLWKFGDNTTSILVSPDKVYSIPGSYNVCLIVSDSASSCLDSVCRQVSIPAFPPCLADFSYSTDPSNTRVRNFTALNPDTTLTYSWNFGDAQTGSNRSLSHNYSSAGSYNVCLSVSRTSPDTCSAQVCKTITLTGPVSSCLSDFTIATGSQDPRNVTFTYSGTSSNVSLFWNFGDNSGQETGAIRTHNYAGFGSYQVCLNVKSNIDTTCFQSTCKTLLLKDTICNAEFTYLQDQNLNRNIFFTAKAEFDSNSTYQWFFGDNSSGSGYSVSHFFNYGKFTVCLKVTKNKNGDSCIAIVCHDVQAGCYADFSYQVDSINPTRITFNGTSSIGAQLEYFWDFGSGFISAPAVSDYSFGSPGQRNVCLKVRSLIDTTCSQTKCKPVSNICQADFSYKFDSLDAFKLYFTNLSYGDTGMIYTWTYSGMGTENTVNPVRTFIQPGWYYVCLKASNPFTHCVTYKCDSILVGGKSSCAAAFAYNTTAMPDISFLNQSVTPGNFYSKWTFGDGNNSIQRDPMHTYIKSSNYQVCLQITDSLKNGCRDSVCKTIPVSVPGSLCNAEFTSIKDTSYKGKGVAFDFTPVTGYAPEAAKYFWVFGDGDSSTQRTPNHVFSYNHEFTVCLYLVNNSDTCYLTHCNLIQVNDSTLSSTPITDYDNRFECYPNPFEDNLFIQFNSSVNGTIKYCLIDIQGREVSVGIMESSGIGEALSIPTGTLSKGSYVLKLVNNNHYYYRRLIK